MPEWRKVFEAEDSDFGAIHRGQGRLEPADRGREWRVPGIRTIPPLLSLCGPSCTAEDVQKSVRAADELP